jgi:hypothetical protein
MVSPKGSGASLLPSSKGEMEHYAEIDVSLDTVSVCVGDGTGTVLHEAKVARTPRGLV